MCVCVCACAFFHTRLVCLLVSVSLDDRLIYVSEREKMQEKTAEDKEYIMKQNKNHNHAYALTFIHLRAFARTHIYTQTRHYAHEKSTPKLH